jgi:predicted nucleic acid-binding protein
MSIFIDTGVFVAFHNTKDVNHRKALDLIKKIATGRLGSAYTSDYIFDEAVTTALIRTKRPETALTIGKMIRGELTIPFLVILRVNTTAFKEAWKLFSQYAKKGLSFTDCTSIALMKMKSIENIASFDTDFDGIVPRIS